MRACKTFTCIKITYTSYVYTNYKPTKVSYIQYIASDICTCTFFVQLILGSYVKQALL